MDGYIKNKIQVENSHNTSFQIHQSNREIGEKLLLKPYEGMKNEFG